MGLPWFAFTIKDFLANTSRLNTEATGAYLLLMLDYYEQEEPPPDDPEVLATITGLSDEAWRRHERVIRPLFEIKGGRWHHDRIEAEIVKGRQRHAQSAAGVAGRKRARLNGASNAAPNGKEPPEAAAPAPAAPKPPPTPPIPASEDVTSNAASDAASIPATTHEHKHSNEDSSNDESARADVQRAASATQVETLFDPDFTVPGSKIVGYLNEGYSSEDVAQALDEFKRYHSKAGTFSVDWLGSWDRWWERKKPPRAMAKPRIEVSRKVAKAIPADWAPNASHHELANELGLNCRKVEDTFRDYCASSGKKYIDHDAAFRNFLRNQPSFNRGSNGQAPASRPDRSITGASARLDATLDRAIAEAQAREQAGEPPVRELPEDGLRQPGSGTGGDADDAE